MSDPFRDEATALDERMQALIEEIANLRGRLSAYEGDNRDVVVAAQLGRLRAEVEAEAEEREDLLAELRSLGETT